MPSQNPSRTPTVLRTQRRLATAFERIIDCYEGYRKLVRRVDSETYAAGMDWCESEESLVVWLSQPAPCLGGVIPLQAMRTAKGRERVAKCLRALTQGSYL